MHSWGGVEEGSEPSEEGPVPPRYTKSIPSHYLVPSIGNQFEWTVQRPGEIWGHDAVDKGSNLHHLDRNKSNRVQTQSITVWFTRGPNQHTSPLQAFSFTWISSLNSKWRICGEWRCSENELILLFLECTIAGFRSAVFALGLFLNWWNLYYLTRLSTKLIPCKHPYTNLHNLTQSSHLTPLMNEPGSHSIWRGSIALKYLQKPKRMNGIASAIDSLYDHTVNGLPVDNAYNFQKWATSITHNRHIDHVSTYYSNIIL